MPVGVLMVKVLKPAAVLLLMVADIVEPSADIWVIVAVIPDGAVMPVAPRKFCPVIVTGIGVAP